MRNAIKIFTALFTLVLMLAALSGAAAEVPAVEVAAEEVTAGEALAVPAQVQEEQAAGQEVRAQAYGPQGVGGNTLEMLYPAAVVEDQYEDTFVNRVLEPLPGNGLATFKFRIANDMANVSEDFIRDNVIPSFKIIDNTGGAYIYFDFADYDAENNILTLTVPGGDLEPGNELELEVKPYLSGANPKNNIGCTIQFNMSATGRTGVPELSGLNCEPIKDGVILQWDGIGTVDGYIILHNGKKIKQVAERDEKTVSAEVKGFDPGERINLSVSAYRNNESGVMVSGPDALIETAAMPANASPKVVSVSQEGALIEWNEVYGASGYAINYNSVVGEPETVKVSAVPGQPQRYTFYDFVPGMKYMFKVTPFIEIDEDNIVWGAGTGNWTFTTKMEAVSGLKYTGKTAGSVDISWEPCTWATHYRVYVNGKQVGTTKVTEADLANDYRVSGLAPATKYSIRVCAVNRASGESVRGESDAIRVQTSK